MVVLDHTAQLGGAEIALVRLLRRIDRARFDPHVVLFSSGPLEAVLNEAGVSVTVLESDSAMVTRSKDDVLGPARLLADSRGAIALAHSVYRELRLLQPDLVHTTSLKADVLGVAPSRLTRTPTVWYVHDRIARGYLPPAAVHLVRLLGAWGPDHVIANSEATRRTLLRPDRVSVIYPGIDVEAYSPRRTSPLTTDSPLVGMLGRVSPTKGQDIFIRAASRVLERHQTARFRVTGDALFGEKDYAQSVRRLPEDLGIADRVQFEGWVADPAAALRSYDLLVHASPVPEPFGQVVVEAMAVGTPVVATDAGGIPEIVRAQGGKPLALLAPPGDPVRLAAAIDAVLTNRAAARRRAAEAREWAVRRFSVAQTAQQVMTVWTHVLAARA